MAAEFSKAQAASSAAESTPIPVGVPRQISKARIWAIMVMAGIVAGLGSWLGGEAVVDFFKPQLFKSSVQQLVIEAPTPASKEAAEVKNAHLAFAILGGILGLSLGFAGGLLRGSLKSAIVAAALGIVLGSAAGFVGSAIAVPIYFKAFDPLSSSLVIPLLVHGSIWASVGAAGGLAFAIGYGDRSCLVLGIVGGIVGGFIGAGIFELVATAAFPFARTNQPVSVTALSRLTARFAVTLSVACLVVIATKMSSQTAPSKGTSVKSTQVA